MVLFHCSGWPRRRLSACPDPACSASRLRSVRKPPLRSPDVPRCRSIEVTAGQVLIFHVTGTEATDFGAFKLSINLQKPGSTLSLATFLDAKATVVASGNSLGYPDTVTSPCAEANTTDGPDVVRAATKPCKAAIPCS